jgi:hypothetical protein
MTPMKKASKKKLAMKNKTRKKELAKKAAQKKATVKTKAVGKKTIGVKTATALKKQVGAKSPERGYGGILTGRIRRAFRPIGRSAGIIQRLRCGFGECRRLARGGKRVPS